MAKKKVLIVVDYQKDFVDGALGFESAKNLDDGIRNISKEFAESTNGVIICTFDTHGDNYLETQEGRKLPAPHCFRGSDGWRLYGETGRYIESLYDGLCTLDGGTFGDCVIDTDTSEALGMHNKLYLVEKPTFPSLRLGDFLRALDKSDGIETITIVGVVTNMCVISNAVIAKAACPEAEIIIKKDLVDSFDKEKNEQALEVMASMQMTVE